MKSIFDLQRGMHFVPGFVLFLMVCSGCDAQHKTQVDKQPVNPVVGLDHWFNHEVHAKTGKDFHYLWADTEFSGYARWGGIFTDRGASLSLIASRPTPETLKGVNLYIIVDPDTAKETASPNYMTAKDADAIEAWVKAGGVLALLANDAGNCDFEHFNQLPERFGMHLNEVTLNRVVNNQWDMAAVTNLPDHPIFEGVKKIYMKEVSTLTLSGPAKAVLKDKDQNVLMAEAKVGKGYVLVITDPWIYNEYMDHDRLPESFENRKAAENLTRYLLSKIPR